MPWSIRHDSRCPTTKPFAVVLTATGEIEGCHPTRAKAVRQQQALYASEAKAFNPNQPRDRHGRWSPVASVGDRAREQRLFGNLEQETLQKLNTQGKQLLKGKPSTRLLYSHGDRYVRGRTSLHKQIVQSFTAGHLSQEHPRAVFTSGGPASGKGQLVTEAPPDSVHADADMIKPMLPEFKKLIDTGNKEIAAGAVHEESSSLAKLITAVAMKRRQNLFLDSSGDGGPGDFTRKLRAAQAAGYDVEVNHMYARTEEAIRREQIRAAKTDRKVDPEVLQFMHEHSAAAMAEVAQVPGVRIKIWSNNDVPEGAHRIIAEGVGGPDGLRGLNVLDRAEFEGFMAKVEAAQKAVAG